MCLADSLAYLGSEEAETVLTSMHLRRYMVVLRLGGVYADIDTECKQPLNDLILPRDTLIVGTENEFGSIEHAKFRSYARERQVRSCTHDVHSSSVIS